MSHIVVYQADDGSSGFEQCGSLEDAVTVAERMRNVDGVESPRIFRMEEIQIDFRPYYRVQVADAEETAAPEPAAAAMPVLDDLPAPPSPEAVAAAEAQSGAAMSSDEPWVEPHASDGGGDHDDATPEATESAGDSVSTESEAPTPEISGAGDIGADDGDPSDDADSSDDADTSDDDAMISVRRGLFGR